MLALEENIKILCIDIKSLRFKLADLEWEVYQSPTIPDIIDVTETHLGPDINVGLCCAKFSIFQQSSQRGWFTLFRLKLFDLARCGIFCIQNFSYKNHLLGHLFLTLQHNGNAYHASTTRGVLW